MEERMKEVVKMMRRTDSLSAASQLSVFFNQIKTDTSALDEATRLAELYLENPASPVRNERLYIDFLDALLAIDSLPDYVTMREKEHLRIASLNRPGSVATDFRFLDRTGVRRSLHTTQGENTLLIFYDPECPHCTDILKDIAEDPGINSGITEGFLKVLAVYAEGNREVWNRTKEDMPSNWTVGYDLSGILEHNLYALPAMPIIYLLNNKKRVILKDPDFRILLSSTNKKRASHR